MYWSAPTAAELKGESYKVSDFVEPTTEVWDEHWKPLLLFQKYSSQWRFGMNGPVALDFNVFHHALDRQGIAGVEFENIVDDLSIIERHALRQIIRNSK